MENPKRHNYKILKTYTIDEIKSHGDVEFFLDEEVTEKRIKLRRAQIFHKRGCNCVEPGCKLTKHHYAVGIDNGGGIHLDLYAYDSEDDLVMMTIDHIRPKSKGGKNNLNNYQTMCKPHNEGKSNVHNFHRKFIDLNSIYPSRELVSQNYRIYKSKLTEQDVDNIKAGDACIAKDYVDDFEIGKEYVILEKRDEGTMMSDHPSETMTNQHFIDNAYGDVLIFGLGIGMIILPLLQDKQINTITVVEKDHGLISLVGGVLDKQDTKNKLKIIHGDAFTYHEKVERFKYYTKHNGKRGKKENKFDTIYFDIWIRVEPEHLKEMETLHDNFSSLKRGGETYITSWLYDIKDKIIERNSWIK